MSEAVDLYTKLSDIRSKVGVVEKRGRNEAQRYDFVKASDVLQEVRGPLVEAGVLVLPELVEAEVRPTERLDKTTGQIVPGLPITRVTLRFALIDVKSGYREDREWIGEGADPADKGLNKAITAATKTFLIALFQIPSGDDAEADPNTDREHPVGAPASIPKKGSKFGVTAKQLKFISSLRTQNQVGDDDFARLLARFDVGGDVESLTGKDASALIDALKEWKPAAAPETDVPADTAGLTLDSDPGPEEDRQPF